MKHWERYHMQQLKSGSQTQAAARGGLLLRPEWLTGYLFILNMVYAVSSTMLGPLMPSIIDEYGIRLSQAGLFVSAKSIGGLLAIVIGIFVSDRLSKKTLLGIAFMAFGLGLFLIGLVNVYMILLVVFFFLGAGSKLSDTILSAYIADLRSERRGYYLTLLHTFFGIGACLSPLYVHFLLQRSVSWNRIFSLLGLIAIGLIILLPILSRRQKESPHASEKPAKPADETLLKPLQLLRSQPYLWFICLMMFFYIGHHATLSVWIPLYMEDFLFMTPAVAGLGITSLWIGMTVGRFLGACLIDRLKPLQMLIYGSLLGAVFMVGGLVMQNGYVLLAALLLNGLATGGTIPLLITIACNRFPAYSGTVSSLTFLSGSFASVFFPWFSGLIAETISFFTAMMLTWLTLLVIAGLGMTLKKAVKAGQ